MRIILPSGHRVVMDNTVDYVQDGVNIVFSYPAGYNVSPWTEPFPSAASASFAILQIDGVAQAGPGSGAIVITGSPASLVSVNPNPFVLHIDTITINGLGFDPNTLGTVYIEDNAGGLLGASFKPVYVSPMQLLANWVSDGNGTTNNVLVYVDKFGRVSNGILVNNTLVWSSVTPNTATVGSAYSGVVAGSGFNQFMSSPFNMQFDNGAGDILNAYAVLVDNQTINLNFFGFDIAGTFELFYSVDSGVTWIDTMLHVTAS